MQMHEKIRELRKAKGLTQKQVADKVGIHNSYISQIENYQINPSLLIAICLADVFNVSLDELVCRDFKGENKMSTGFAITTLIELFIGILLVYGFMHEDKVIAFEKAVKRIVVGHYRRFKRKILNRIIDRKVAELNVRYCKYD